jgi:phage/plasmid-associated DNA primase
MSDPFKTSTPQDEHILTTAKYRNAKAKNKDERSFSERLSEHCQAMLDYAEGLLEELEQAHFTFGHVRGASISEPALPYMYDRHFHIWVPAYKKKTQWETLLRTDADFYGVLENREMWPAFQSALYEKCRMGFPVTLNPPLAGIPFANGVFDFKLGGLRYYTAEDGRTFLGKTQYLPTGKRPEEVLRLISYMANGDSDLEELIYAVCWLHITGVHNLPTFKSAFFVWACPNGYSGRTALFDVINRASGGNAAVSLAHLDDLSNPNILALFEGRNYGIVDEANTVMSARSKSMSVLKQMVGGVTSLPVKKLYMDRHEAQGHWIISQALNSMSLIYAADKPLVDRTVAIVTSRIPEEEIEAFQTSVERQQRQRSETEASAFVYFLWKRFGAPENAASTVDRLKGKYKESIDELADSASPFREFCNEALVEKTGNKVMVKTIVSAFNRWLSAMYPTNKPKTIRSIMAELRAQEGFTVEKEGDNKPYELFGFELKLDTHY